MADLDRDGRTDLVSGDFFGRVHWFQRAVEGGFGSPVLLTDSAGQPLDAGDASYVFPFDLDRDGRVDLMLGNMDGTVQVARGLKPKQPASVPSFSAFQALEAVDGPVIAPSGDAAPILGDWDGDGREDLILGAQDGSVRWWPDLAQDGAPQFGFGEQLIGPLEWTTVPEGRSDKRVKLDLVDWNADGQLDLLVGDATFAPGEPGDEQAYEQAQTALRQAEAAMKPWYERQRARTRELYGPTGEEGLDGKRWALFTRQALAELEQDPAYLATVEAHLAAIEHFTRTDSKTREQGHVWVYLRRTPAEDAPSATDAPSR